MWPPRGPRVRALVGAASHRSTYAQMGGQWMSNQLPDQSQHRNHPTSTTDREPPTLDHDQPLIDVIGREGTVTTPDGETAVGTTPIGVGSLEPVGQHQDTADPS